ncbi:MAG: ATP-dependent sacrificial sulfur transferase LarE [Deltaproteobacteria bacterium]|nr:ATP-dependent sacrificial sulfur transferase LarE [Deltaproteobacteria bacterium]
MDAKLDQLKSILVQTESLLVAFSAGVDSTFLLKVAHMVLGDGAIALTASSPTAPPGELDAAREFTGSLGCRHIILNSHELANPQFSQNPANRCFFCKDELYRICRDQARQLGVNIIVDGTNLDDLKDHRPGLKAAKAFGVRHPLVEAEMTKNDIRRCSRALGLPTWDKPSSPCLSSRFPYGTEINLERLKQVADCEIFLKELRFREFRVRYHGDLARIEVAPNELERLMERETRDVVVRRFKEVGFKYISLDLQGYRTGSLNEALAAKPN